MTKKKPSPTASFVDQFVSMLGDEFIHAAKKMVRRHIDNEMLARSQSRRKKLPKAKVKETKQDKEGTYVAVDEEPPVQP